MLKRILLLLMFLSFGLPATAQTQAAAHKPNIDLYVYRRAYTPDEKIQVRLTGYNVHAVAISLYRLSVPSLFAEYKRYIAQTVSAADISALPRAAAWTYKMDKTNKVYPDQWAERAVEIPKIAPGVYMVRATAADAEKRVWLVVTNVALLAKRSRRELLIYAADAHSGKPESRMALTIAGKSAERTRVVADEQGVVRIPRAAQSGPLRIYGERDGNPAFLYLGAPAAPEPFAVYITTDRPIYRPSHRVRYKAVVRERVETAEGVSYRVAANRKAVLEIRDPTDALIIRRDVTTNAFGSLDGDFQLASEPALGNWQIVVAFGDFRAYGNFEAEAYRKPEFAADVHFDGHHALGGSTVPIVIDSRYFFGQPVAGATVSYNIFFQPEYRYNANNQDAQNQAPEPAYNGQGVTDAQGRLKLEIKTQRLPFDRRLTIAATVTDLSRRSAQANGDILVTAGRFQLSVETDKSVYRVGDKVPVIVRATDYDGKPVATKVRIQLIEIKYDRKMRPYREVTTRDATTDAKGEATVFFKPPRPGDLSLTAEAFDEQDNKIRAFGSVWMVGDKEEFAGYEYPTLNLLPDKTAYRPGEVASILLNTSLVGSGPSQPDRRPRHNNSPPLPQRGRGGRGVRAQRGRGGRGVRAQRGRGGRGVRAERKTHDRAWALVTVEGEGLYEHRIVPLVGRSNLLRVTLKDSYFPAATVNVAILQDRELYEQQIVLPVRRDDKNLTVSVTPDKPKYAPGEEATYAITARDNLGRPVAAEFALGVVDASIYAIRPDSAPDLFSFFYAPQPVRVETDYSFSAQYSGGAFQTVATPKLEAAASPTNGKPAIRVRRQFADTAYWNAFVTTDADGAARVSFKLPDNLTTWRATARGVTTETQVGAATNDVVSAMPLLVRLELPRFWVRGDEAVVSAVIHNYTGSARSVAVSIEADDIALTGDAKRVLNLPAGGQERVDWKGKIHPGDTPGSARILVTADGGEGARDATELTLPVAADGVKIVDARAESVESEPFRLNLRELPANATVTLSLAPTLAGPLFDALDALAAYPYGCAEQTMSAFLPDIAVARAFHNLGIARKPRPDLEKWVNLGLQKLYRYQHQDGGWQWWEFDESDADMTSYILWGLIQAREAGYLVDEQRIKRGAEYLFLQLKNEREWNRIADRLLTLSYVAPKRIKNELASAFDHRDKLDSFALASLCMALSKAGDAAKASQIAKELEGKVKVVGTAAYWPAEEGGYSWRSDDILVTARVVRALLTVAPKSRPVFGAVRYMMAHRIGMMWQSTRSSSEAVLALAQYMETTRELNPEFRAAVRLDGQELKTLSANAQTALNPPTTLTLTPAELRGHNELIAEKSGAGVLYVSAVISHIIPSAQAQPIQKGIAVRRRFTIVSEDPSQTGVPSGEEVEVETEVTADGDYPYAILEDPIPAGCEVAPVADNDFSFVSYFENRGGYARQEVRDDRVVFFFDSLPKGRSVIRYRLHAETPGLYRILPGEASLVYFPEIRGDSRPVRIQVEERR